MRILRATRPGKDGLRGILQLEYRANPKTGTQREPYWYFRYREGGRQRTLYVGTDRLEEALAMIAFELGDEAGARLARELGLPVSPDALPSWLLACGPLHVRCPVGKLSQAAWPGLRRRTLRSLAQSLIRNQPEKVW